ncbi:CocE/NonD family hydrolase [Sphingosinicella rhizophila]|uniref:CocE/NonD family hydrolase n=1 Tax=Sphingosinicella rhizophila TaxID=3050082 RepID=A0ABU3Q8M5_9SPHN|nr:CocE/NonD family hydrolase [Sphingosinicella sp. GR2756]MDT9599760.1 CocE/NonD family hydrolase [Sphingosinicella sp. GR2756]
MRSLSIVVLVCAASVARPVTAQDLSKYSQEAQEREIATIADARTAVMVPMRDGVRLSTNIYSPKAKGSRLPTILWKTPYNEHKLRGPTLRYAIESVRRGYVFIVQNERGRFFSEGQWEILGKPQTDGYDMLSWIAAQGWSNGKVGTLGCSSSAEWQLALAGMNHPAHAAMVPMSSGAGIGKIGRFQEQGNWYTGGVPRNLFFVWLYGVDNPLRAQLPANLDEKTRAHITQYNDLNATKPKIDWNRQIKHLPVSELLSSLGEPPATFEQFIARTPADARWRQGGLYHEDMGWGVPALWFNAWYDVSIGPNLELFNHARAANTDREASANQYAVIAPVTHCAYASLGRDTRIGDRDMGDTTFDMNGAVFGWFDRWLKGDRRAFPASTPHVRYFLMGANRWASSESWPPKGAETVRFYLRSGGAANSLNGDGRLDRVPPGNEPADRFRYDPMNPVPTVGGGDCCNGGIVVPGAFDQRGVEARNDVLVYTSDPLPADMEVSGFVNAVLKVSSSEKDTDFAVKLVDVAPDGTAWIIADTIFRARYREGFDTPVLMEPGKTYTIKPSPIATSIQFGKGHRIRIEVTSSNFPKFVRNLNTGGPNEFEATGIVAENVIHHSAGQQSYIDLPVVR